MVALITPSTIGMPRSARRGLRLRHRPADPGFALALALMGAMVLLLGCLAAQSSLHQVRLSTAAANEQRRVEDALASAAHQLVDRVVRRHGCLLLLPLQDWAQKGSCADPLQQASLRQGSGAALDYGLLHWRPVPAGSPVEPRRLELELVRRPAGRHPSWRAAFALDLQGDPPRVLALREFGLRGVQP
ncbi:MAG: hypothetical protein ACK55X_03650 [Synechococcaceae cyanobacterium]|jgi:hypothetical protein